MSDDRFHQLEVLHQLCKRIAIRMFKCQVFLLVYDFIVQTRKGPIPITDSGHITTYCTRVRHTAVPVPPCHEVKSPPVLLRDEDKGLPSHLASLHTSRGVNKLFIIYYYCYLFVSLYNSQIVADLFLQFTVIQDCQKSDSRCSEKHPGSSLSVPTNLYVESVVVIFLIQIKLFCSVALKSLLKIIGLTVKCPFN